MHPSSSRVESLSRLTRSSKVLLLVAALVILASLGACRGRACTLLACSDSVVIDLRPPLRGDGHYLIALDVDGISRRCEFSVPPERLDPPMRCPEGSRMALDGEREGLSRIVVAGVPRKIDVSITVDGKPARRATLEPSYSVHRPNGEGCDPVCRTADVTLGDVH